MKASELRNMAAEDLRKKLAELRKKVQEFNFSIANNQLAKVREVRQAKKDIARILTILNSGKDQNK